MFYTISLFLYIYYFRQEKKTTCQLIFEYELLVDTTSHYYNLVLGLDYYVR